MPIITGQSDAARRIQNNHRKIERVLALVDGQLDATVLAIIDVPDATGLFPAAVVAWERDEGLRTSYGAHLLILPDDQTGWLDSGDYVLDRASAIESANKQALREAARADRHQHLQG